MIKLKKYRNDNKDKINEYFRKRRDSDLNYIFACNLRTRTSLAFKSQNVRRTNKTFDFLGCSHSYFKRWINQQLYGNMTLKDYGSVWQIDHCLAVASFNLLDEKEMKKCFNWINVRPLYVKDNITKGNKISMRLYLLQQIKGNYSMELNDQKGLN